MNLFSYVKHHLHLKTKMQYVIYQQSLEHHAPGDESRQKLLYQQNTEIENVYEDVENRKSVK